MYGNSFLDKLDRKFGRYALKNLMTVIVIGTAIVWLLRMLVYSRTGVDITAWLYFNKAAILKGEVWRVVTFVFVPETYNLITFVLSLYFYWLIGNSLENTWGSFKFDLFYLCGLLGAIVSGFITGYATVDYLHLSLFLAFALLYPDHQLLLFYFLPIKVKWLALIDLVGLVLLLIFSVWVKRIALLVALLNVALFFCSTWFRSFRVWYKRRKWKKDATPPKNKDNDYPFEL